MKERHPTIRSIIREEMRHVLQSRDDKPIVLSTQDYIKIFHAVKAELVEETK